jgi:pyruvate-formate lyase-activating enzyme
MAYVGTELVATEMEVNSGGEVAISGGEICLVFVRGVSFAKATKELGFAMVPILKYDNRAARPTN